VGAIDLGNAHSDSKLSINSGIKMVAHSEIFKPNYFGTAKKNTDKKARRCKGGTGRQKGYIRVSKNNNDY
jgi:hypothetical protein